MSKGRKKIWTNIVRIGTVARIAVSILTIYDILINTDSTPTQSYEMENNNGIVIDENYGNFVFDFPKNEDTKITLIAEDLYDLSYAGIYPLSREAKVTIGGRDYYKKGIVINTEFNNESNNSKTITDINFIIDNMEKIDYSVVDFIPVDFDDKISIYAINNGNLDIKNNYITVGSTFNDIWDGTENISYETKDNILLELTYGEVKEICHYSYSELLEIFDNKEGWLHIFLLEGNKKLICFDSFICNIAYDNSEFDSFINQGGDGVGNKIVPVFVNGETAEVEILNKYAKIINNGATEIQFLILPDRPISIKFHVEIVFSDGVKIIGDEYSSNILVPVYDDESDFFLLNEAIKLSNTKRMIYGREESVDSSFLYNPKKFYDNLVNW